MNGHTGGCDRVGVFSGLSDSDGVTEGEGVGVEAAGGDSPGCFAPEIGGFAYNVVA